MISFVFPPHPLKKEELADIYDAKFEVHFIEAKIIHNTDENEMVHMGSGYIRQNADGSFDIRLYDSNLPGASSISRSISRMLGYSTGQILSSDMFYYFSGMDRFQREWKTAPFLMNMDSTSGNGTIVTGTAKYITCAKKILDQPHQETITMRFFQDFELPYNTPTDNDMTSSNYHFHSGKLDALHFESIDSEIYIRNESSTIIVHATCKNDSFPEHFDTRLLESLRFTTMRPLHWSMLTRMRGGVATSTIRHVIPENQKGDFKPPITNNIGFDFAFSEMFTKFLSFIGIYDKQQLHPISSQILSVARSKALSVETQALVLSVAIESIVKHTNIDNRKLSAEDKKWIKKVRKYFMDLEGSVHMRNRILGLLGMINNSSTSAKLEQLAALGAITHEQVRKWKELRNKTAHGEDLMQVEIQELLLLCDSVLVLMYHLTFYIIGYSGKYTNYSILGWPTENYFHPTIIGDFQYLLTRPGAS